MSLYTDLTPYYDALFAVNAQEMAFTASLLSECTSLLDIGCGTGNRTEHLCTPQKRIIAIDQDSAMIAYAKTVHSAPCVEYKVMDMMEIDHHFVKSSFDGILCFGNTLVHLASQDDIRHLCIKAHALLKPAGLFIVQILNYDRILADRITQLPVLQTPEARLERRYEWKEGRMHFRTDLHVKHMHEALKGDTVLYPLGSDDLTTILGNAGFKDIKLYGDFEGHPYTDQSFILYAVCSA